MWYSYSYNLVTAIKSNQKQHNDKNNAAEPAEGQPGHKMALMATHRPYTWTNTEMLSLLLSQNKSYRTESLTQCAELLF